MLLAAVMLAAKASATELAFASVFSSDMVLQRSSKSAVYGFGAPHPLPKPPTEPMCFCR